MNARDLMVENVKTVSPDDDVSDDEESSGPLAHAKTVGGEAAGAVGLGQMMGLLGGLLTLLAQLDDLMQLFGGLALALSVVVLGVYAWSPFTPPAYTPG